MPNTLFNTSIDSAAGMGINAKGAGDKANDLAT
jgi:hypothetical protein